MMPAAARPGPDPYDAGAAERPRVLVVDDEDGIRAFLADAFRDAGYDVREAADGLDALRTLQSWPADVLLLDLVMPRMHGWDVARVCRTSGMDRSHGSLGVRRSHSPRIVLMTAAGPAARRAADETGADALLVKPLNVDEVLGLTWSLTRPTS